MDGPVRRGATWYRRGDDGRWWRWDEPSHSWQPHAGPPPPPPPPPRAAHPAPGPGTPAAAATRLADPAAGGGAPGAGAPARDRLEPYRPPAARQPLGRMAALAAAGVLAFAGGWLLVDRVLLDRDPPTPEELAAALAPVAGYTYSELPGNLPAQLEAILGEEADERIAGVDGALAGRAGRIVGVVMVLGVDPDEIGQDDVGDFTAGMRLGPGAAIERVPYGGTDIYQGRAPSGAGVAIFYDPDGILFVVAGERPAVVRELAEGLAGANL